MEGQGDEEEHSKMSILLVSIGEVDLKIIQILKDDLKRIFNKPVEIGKGLSEPHYAYNKIRSQYHSPEAGVLWPSRRPHSLPKEGFNRSARRFSKKPAFHIAGVIEKAPYPIHISPFRAERVVFHTDGLLHVYPVRKPRCLQRG